MASGGGHTGHAVALAEHLLEAGASVGFIVRRGDYWSAWRVRGLGPVVAETTQPYLPGESAARGLLRGPRALLESLAAVYGSADLVVSTGSNHGVPPALASRALGRPLVHVETPVRVETLSASTRFLAPLASAIIAQWGEQARALEGLGAGGRAFVTGPIYERPRHPARDGGYILLAGGTYGYRELYEAFLEAGFREVAAQTGRVDPSRYRERGWAAFRFDPDLQRWIAGARLVVSHLGRTVIDAALTYRKPVAIAPNPRWALGRSARPQDAAALARKLNLTLIPPGALKRPGALRGLVEAASQREPRRLPNGGRLAARIIARLASRA